MNRSPAWASMAGATGLPAAIQTYVWAILTAPPARSTADMLAPYLRYPGTLFKLMAFALPHHFTVRYVHSILFLVHRPEQWKGLKAASSLSQDLKTNHYRQPHAQWPWAWCCLPA